MARRAAPPRRQARTTLLVVGEGYAEFELLKHLRAVYTSGSAGFAMTVKNARGKGAGNVIEQVIRQHAQVPFDRRVALLDTDDGWTLKVRALARRHGIEVVASSPCLEAWLLDIRGHAGERSTAEHKREFERRFGCEAHLMRVPDHFPRDVLDAARQRVATLHALLTLMGV